MTRARFLPQYVTGFVDRHGRTRLRFRRVGWRSGYFKAALGTEEFRAEYRAFMDAVPPLAVARLTPAAPGTLDDLVTRYLSVPARLGPTAATQAKVRAIISRFREGRGSRMVAAVTFEHIDAIVAKKRVKVEAGKRMEGGVEAARKLRKELVRLFDFAVKIGFRRDNPVAQSDRVKVAAGERSTGFYSWTEGDIAQYRDTHPLGSRARLAMELMLWTAQRRVDAIRMGPQDVHEGRMTVRQSKGGKHLEIAVAPQLLAAIVAVTPIPGQTRFLLTEYSKPFTNPGFGNWFRVQCDVAGLPQCTAHGLRKAAMRRLAQLHFSNQGLKALSGHSGDDEVATYTRAVDQERLASDAIRALAEWEVSILANASGLTKE